VRPRLIVSAVVCTSLVLAACGGGSGGGSAKGGNPALTAGANTVVLRNIAFRPDTITVAVGDTVTWVWNDGDVPHDVVFKDIPVKSAIMTKGTFRHTFDSAGTFRYVCTIHPSMTGKVVVTG
jgi:plastocyanin